MNGNETNYPKLSERACGWLRYMYRKALVNDDWSKNGHPSEMWDAKDATSDAQLASLRCG
jgi:hypothetical protein